MTSAEITGLAMAVAAVLGTAFSLFSSRRSKASAVSGTNEISSWGELVEGLQNELNRLRKDTSAEIDRVRAEGAANLSHCEAEMASRVGGLSASLHSAEARIRDLETYLASQQLGLRPPRPE